MGSVIATALQRAPLAHAYTIVGLHDQDRARASRLARQLRGRIPVLPVRSLIRRSDVLVEAASVQAAKQIVPRALRARREVVAMSVGGILPLAGRLPSLTRRGGRLWIPSGAIAGLDGIKAARLGPLKRVTLTTRKPPRSLQGASGARCLAPITLFRGSAAQAVRLFPQNINVAATLALAGLGATRTEVRIVADPTIRRNIHEISAVGSFGRLLVRAENVPSRQNPKTSTLAILSALAALAQLARPWRVGT